MNLRTMFRRKRTVNEAVSEEVRFRKWVRKRHGNVYGLWQEYLVGRTGATITVSYNWWASNQTHGTVNHAWVSGSKLPKWFKRWVKEVGRGMYGTEKGLQGARPNTSSTKECP